jgi:glycosyltransferase involved in cell wall biosynthesis
MSNLWGLRWSLRSDNNLSVLPNLQSMAPMAWPRVALVMIVKDEEAVIERALRSAIPWIQTWCIVDTGSTDSTKDVIRRVMAEADTSGCLHERPWVNFGHNRTEALELCRGIAEWAIMLDADDNLMEGPPPARELWDHLELDAMAMRIRHEQIWHNRVQIFRVDADWCYEGVLHEQPRCRGVPEPKVLMLPEPFGMETRCAGVRSRDPQKYIKDAALLEAEWLRDPSNMRSLYYLAQSYRDAGMTKEAIHYYRKYVERTADGGIHERYMAYVNLILLVDDAIDQVDLAWTALDICPDRLEAPFTLLNRRRRANLAATQQIYAMAAICKNRKPGKDWPYVNPAVYAVGFDDEFAVVAFSTGHFQEAYDASMRCVLNSEDPAAREAAVKNARACLARLSS